MSILRPLRMMRIAVAAGQVSPQLGRCAAFSQLKNLACMGSPLVNPLSLHSKRLLSTSEQPKAETSKGQTTSSTEGNIDAPQDAPSRGPTVQPISWATFFLLLATGTGVIVYYNVQRAQRKIEAQSKVETFGKAALGGPWSLVDSAGIPVTSGDLLGHYYVMYFGFTYCPDICPNEMVKMGKALDIYEKKSASGSLPDVIPVFVTLDPHRDSCAQVGAYVKDFHPRMVALTGTPSQVARVAKRFRVYFAEVDRNEEDDDYLVDHSIVMYLMGPDGGFIDFYTQLMSAPEIADKVAATIARLEKEAGRGPQAGGLGAWLGGLLGGSGSR